MGAPPPVGDHGYFDALLARPDFWKGYSLRPRPGEPIASPYYEHQLKHPKDGGYAHSGSAPLWVTYAPSTDTDPDRQDAAKIVIPAWATRTALAGPMQASTPGASETLTFTGAVSVGSSQGLRIGAEIVKIDGLQPQHTSMRVKRGQFGTAADAHSTGTVVQFSVNSLLNQVRLPLGTTDGHVYVFTWDVLWTSSYVRSGLTNHKAFQFSTGTNDSRSFLEPQARYSGMNAPGFNPATDVASLVLKSYNRVGGNAVFALNPPGSSWLGPGVTLAYPIQPQIGSFIVKPNVWTRHWVQINQIANDYAVMDAWVADETHAAVQLYASILTTLPSQRMQKFWIEFNTSTDNYVRGDARDLVAYVRNFVALMDVADVQALLVQPS